MDKYPIKTYILGNTLTAAFQQLIKLVNNYQEYDIKINHFICFNEHLIVYFSNKEEISVMSFNYFKQPHIGQRINNVYFDKDIPEKEFWEIADVLILPALKSPRSMWQF